MNLDTNIPLLLSLLFIGGGLYLLSKSADRFVEEASRIASWFGVSPFIIGMLVIGFGTSAPELAVSVLSALVKHSDLSLGNAYGSCIFNVGGILGVTALISPIEVKPRALLIGASLLLAICFLSFFLCSDMSFSRFDGLILLAIFALAVPVYCYCNRKSEPAAAQSELSHPVRKITFLNWLALIVSLLILVGSSHVLVWGCVDFARDVLGVSPLIIGLTVVAVGTSLPELASALASARRGEHDFIIGNIIGSNILNMLAVVGMAGSIAPFDSFSRFIIVRDMPVMFAFSLMVFLFGFNFRKPTRDGIIGRASGAVWLFLYLIYLVVMIFQEIAPRH